MSTFDSEEITQVLPTIPHGVDLADEPDVQRCGAGIVVNATRTAVRVTPAGGQQLAVASLREHAVGATQREAVANLARYLREVSDELLRACQDVPAGVQVGDAVRVDGHVGRWEVEIVIPPTGEGGDEAWCVREYDGARRCFPIALLAKL